MDSTAQWRSTIGPAAWDSAFNRGPVPLCAIPGLERACRIEPDTMHVFHLGFGQDLCAGTIVLLSRFHLFRESGTLEEQMAAGYDSYMTFCHREKKTTSCDAFNKLKFGMSSNLNCAVGIRFLCLE